MTEKRSVKTWEELTLADHFIFKKFMMNEEICKEVLSEILGKEVVKIKYFDYEKTVEARYDAKGIRMDVYIRGENEVYNVEIQNELSYDIPKRCRYYHDLIDLDLLEKGMDYEQLCHSYVIFICTFDYFGQGQYKYTFRNRCEEVEGLSFGDLSTSIILNTKGVEGNVSDKLKIFLKSIEGVFSNDAFSARIKEEYEEIKKSGKWRKEYMWMDLELRDQHKRGYEEGLSEGHQKGTLQTTVKFYLENIISLDNALEMTGLTELRHASMLTLSGGETQRVFLAQVFAQDPQVLILDEPANHLDLKYQKHIFSLIQEWLKEPGRAVLSVVHDLSLARRYGSHAILMDHGKSVSRGPIDEVMTSGNLEQVYGMNVYAWMQEMLGQWQ